MRKSFLTNHFDYLLILIFFVIPPIFSTGQGEYSPQAPIAALLLRLLISSYIIFKYKTKGESLKKLSFPAVISILGLLLTNGLFWNFLAALFETGKEKIVKVPPESVTGIIYALISLIIAALYEELLYRQYLPDESLSIIPNKSLRLPMEILLILLFALGHSYLGVWAVLNAFTAGCLLRFFCKKTGSFLSGFIAHFLYNGIVFFLM